MNCVRCVFRRTCVGGGLGLLVSGVRSACDGGGQLNVGGDGIKGDD